MSESTRAVGLMALAILMVANVGRAAELPCTRHVTADPAAGGGDGSVSNPWTLPEALAQTGSGLALGPGDVVCLHPEFDYLSSINPHAGSSSAAGRLSFQNVPGMARPIFKNGACFSFSESDWIRISGIHCSGKNEAAPDRTKGPHLTLKAGRMVKSHNVLENSIFEYFRESGVFVGGGEYNQIRNNVVRYVGDWDCPSPCGSGDAFEMHNAPNTLVEGNVFEYATHIPFAVGDSPGSVIRDNVIRNPWMRSDMGNGREGDQALLGWTPGPSTDHLVFEGNVVRDMGTEADLDAESRDFAFGSASPQAILRHNTIVRNEIAGIKLNTAGLVPASWGSKVYGNVSYDNGFHGLTITEGGNGNNDASHNDIRNNIIAHNGRTIDQQPFNPNSVLSGPTVQANLYSMNNIINWPSGMNPTTELDSNTYRSNDIVDGDCGAIAGVCQTAYTSVLGALVTSVEDTVFGTRTEQTLVQVEADVTWGPNFLGNVEVAPGFRDEAADDFSLASTSALVDAGTALTQTASCDAPTQTVVVDDAGFFTAGLTDPLSLEKLVDGDLIRIGAELRKVKQVDYTTNTLTLSVAISCSAGEPVNLNFTGSGPDIGYRDYDGDGVIDARDNCPTIASTNLNDQDDDGIGDICDPGTPGVPALPLLGQLFGAALLLGSSAVALRRFTPGRGLPDTR